MYPSTTRAAHKASKAREAMVMAYRLPNTQAPLATAALDSLDGLDSLDHVAPPHRHPQPRIRESMPSRRRSPRLQSALAPIA
jgi:hypothetical protein